ncbi:hypothetical protein BDP27DRAFT_1371271 [Rhodocollybia butyracea]|uniref:Uncharacterized protein n=1 Tax=Rhodocollybia butyracea TaxID=206335 RepID=A0A9P5PCJ5_9AGAR|nr:hypothetical protein BDP27DRAFT_1371271 [Rhodocollybia butyracea]
MFSKNISDHLNVPEHLDVQSLEISDQFFNSFHQRAPPHKTREPQQKQYKEEDGHLRSTQGWLKIPQELFIGSELQVKDREGDLIFHVDFTLSQEKRNCLQLALLAWSRAVKHTISGAELKNQNTAETSHTEFSMFHFSYFSKYRQKGVGAPEDIHPLHLRSADGSKTNHSQFFIYGGSDMLNFSEEYNLLSTTLGETLQEIVTKVQPT